MIPSTIPTEQFLRVKWLFDFEWLTRFMKIRTACEVGVGPRDISAMQFFRPGINCEKLIGVEPNPEFHCNVTEAGGILYPVAIVENEGVVKLHLAGGSSAVDGTFCQTGRKTIEVEGWRFDAIDDGKIDFLNIDCEGCEIHVLERMKSRPEIIGIETWPHDPNGQRVRDWLHVNGYCLRLTSGPEGETQLWTKV